MLMYAGTWMTRPVESVAVQPPWWRGVAWESWMLTLWAAGFGLAFGAQLRSWVGLARVVRTAGAARARFWQPLLGAVGCEVGVRPRVRLLQSDAIEIPVTWGVSHPGILLPLHADRCPATSLTRLGIPSKFPQTTLAPGTVG